jgi:hypothetical protein
MRQLLELFGAYLFVLEHSQFSEHPGYQNAIPVLPNTSPWHNDSIACYCTKAIKVHRHTLFCSIIELTDVFLKVLHSVI